MNQTIKRFLKWLRVMQPLNYVVTTLTHGFLSSTRLRSELVVKHLHRIGSVRSKLPNGRVLRLESNGQDFVPNQVFWRGWSGYEPETLPLFFRLASNARITFDIGAHLGLFAIVAGHANSEGRVYAFEPVPSIYNRLKRHVELNELSNVSCINKALADFDGEAEIFHAPGDTLTASLSLEFMQWQKNWKPSVISVATADQFIKDHLLERIDLVKVDTESTEPQVLKGMAKTLERDHPNIICEVLSVNGVAEALMDTLRPLGYYFYQLTDKGIVWRNDIEFDVDYRNRNYLFSTIPPNSISQLTEASVN